MNLKKIALIGANGYVGKYYQQILHQKSIEVMPFGRGLNKNSIKVMKETYGVDFLINCGGYTGKPNVDACENQKSACLTDNSVFPAQLGEWCEEIGLPWGHVSSGCIYSGNKTDGTGFTEEDEPNFSFRQPPCSFYSGTKALGEEMLKDKPCYIWRLRVPFDGDLTNPRNYLYKVLNYDMLLDARNSLSHIGDFVNATLECIEKDLPFGIYNVVNGDVWTHDVTAMLAKIVPSKKFNFFKSLEDFNNIIIAPRSNCVLDNFKIENLGVKIRSVQEALYKSIS